MPAYRSPARRTGRTAAALLGGLTSAALVLTLAPAAAAAPAQQPPAPGESIAPGEAYLGVGTRIEQGLGAVPDTGGVGPADTGGVQGIDVSHWQGAINWGSVKSSGISFAYIKATEGTGFKDSRFNTNYTAAHNAGVIRGAYHFARPNASGGAAQADYFASNGGAWSRDNLTLPGMLDLEGGCYGLSQASMQNWILSFYNEYKARTGRDVLIYTSSSWWNSCTGGWSGMSARSPLWVANWTSAADPTIPNGFPYATVWQYTDSGSVSGVPGAVDRDRFNGDHSRLLALANNT
jgi:GH25 family lysozyme M1 (1,4-beta-N-acetylmuramidase)